MLVDVYLGFVTGFISPTLLIMFIIVFQVSVPIDVRYVIKASRWLVR